MREDSAATETRIDVQATITAPAIALIAVPVFTVRRSTPHPTIGAGLTATAAGMATVVSTTVVSTTVEAIPATRIEAAITDCTFPRAMAS